MTKSQESNVVKVVDAGSGRKGTTYAFDYSYCVLQEIPTHYIIGTEKIDKQRSLMSGEWISRVTNINEEIIAQSEIPNKIEGTISFLSNDKGFILGEDGFDYFFTRQYIIESDTNKTTFLYHYTPKIRVSKNLSKFT